MGRAAREDGDAVALSEPYRETLDRHVVLLRQAEPFRACPEAFASLLAERARIGRGDLEEFEALHEPARRHRRAATMRQTHRARRETERQVSPAETRDDVRPAHEEVVEAASLVPPDWLDSVPPPTDEEHAEAAWEAREDLAPPAPEPPKPDWRSAWEPVIGEWNALIDRARHSGTIAFYMKGYSELIPRIRALTENPDVPADRRESLVPLLESHERHLTGRKRVEDFLDAAERHRHRRNALEQSSDERGVTITQTPDYGQWRGTADRLLQEGKAILADRNCAPHLDRISSVRKLAEARVSGLGETIREDDRELAEAEREARERRRLNRELARLRFAADASTAVQPEPAPPTIADHTRADRLLWQLRRIHDWDGRLAESERQAAIEAATRASLERWANLRLRWNLQVDRAGKKGVHVIYTAGYETLYRELQSLARDDPYTPEEVRSEIDRVIYAAGAAERTRDHVVQHGAAIAARLARRREMLDSGWSWDKRAFVDREVYDPWRRDTEKAVEAAESLLVRTEGLRRSPPGSDAPWPPIRSHRRARGAARGRPSDGGGPGARAQGRRPAPEGGAHRRPSRRPGEAARAAQAADRAKRGAQGRSAAPAQGTVSGQKHAHVGCIMNRCSPAPCCRRSSAPAHTRPHGAVRTPLPGGRRLSHVRSGLPIWR